MNEKTHKDCDNCPESVHITDSQIDQQMELVRKSGVPITPEGRYNERLEICLSCEQLVYGTTCMSCGCLVKVRALNALRICPHPSGAKW
jgi:hypothetical protein